MPQKRTAHMRLNDQGSEFKLFSSYSRQFHLLCIAQQVVDKNSRPLLWLF